MLVCISGSLRARSCNTSLLKAVAEAWSDDVRFGDIRLPLYDKDLEDREGLPYTVARLASDIRAADAIVLATPEYNHSLSGVLKNALDWVSRADPNPWENKPVGIVSAAAGSAGGARGSYALRLAMTPFKARLLTTEILVANASDQFDSDGRLNNECTRSAIAELVENLRKEASR